MFGVGGQIPCSAPEAAPRLEAGCEVPAFRGWQGAEVGWGKHRAGAGFRKRNFHEASVEWGRVRLLSLDA